MKIKIHNPINKTKNTKLNEDDKHETLIYYEPLTIITKH